jgi:hypothetical protein
MKWLCVFALVVNMLLIAYSGFAFITVPASEVEKHKARLRAAVEKMDVPQAEGQDGAMSPDSSVLVPDEEPVEESEGAAKPAEVPEGLEGAVGVEGRSTYDIDHEADPYGSIDRTKEGVEEAKRTMRKSPFR